MEEHSRLRDVDSKDDEIGGHGCIGNCKGCAGHAHRIVLAGIEPTNSEQVVSRRDSQEVQNQYPRDLYHTTYDIPRNAPALRDIPRSEFEMKTHRSADQGGESSRCYYADCADD